MNSKHTISALSLVIVLVSGFYAQNAFSNGYLSFSSLNEKNIFQKKTFLNSRIARPGIYNFAFGVCGGLNSGITFKKFLGEEQAMEFILSTHWRGVSLTAFYEACVGANLRGDGLIWNVGLGPRFGFYQGAFYRDYLGASREDRLYSVLGFAGTFGFEYYFLKIPFSIGLDYRPYFDLKGADDSIIDGAVNLRFVF